MIHKFSYEHNIEHNRSKITALQLHPKIIGKNLSEAIYANLVNKITCNCGILAVVMGIILSIISKYFEHCSKVGLSLLCF